MDYVNFVADLPTVDFGSATEPVAQEVVDLGGALYRKWHPSHGTDIR
jgi:hypothetical protein